ncbi:hypothetical protein [Abyssisolibacter fermentans]|uniref:hypothetical protein n=1 Tax=Abyssisolibacter fermentans TaxID=1766203 RepID=UPI00082B91D6|nr:hypothetical protein [Abyssisolibacter fermentans]
MKSVVIPQSGSYYEKLEKTPIGQQKYWWDLFYSDYNSSIGLLEMIMNDKELSAEIVNNKYALKAIFSGYEKHSIQTSIKEGISNLELKHNK